MFTCPVCDAKSEKMVCSRCGFDGSCDYERYPTLQRLKGRPDSVARLRERCSTEGNIATIQIPQQFEQTDNTIHKKRYLKWIGSGAIIAVVVLTALLVFFGKDTDNSSQDDEKSVYTDDSTQDDGILTMAERVLRIMLPENDSGISGVLELPHVVNIDGEDCRIEWSLDQETDVMLALGPDGMELGVCEGAEDGAVFTLLAHIYEPFGESKFVSWRYHVIVDQEKLDGKRIVLYHPNPSCPGYMTDISRSYTGTGGEERWELQISDDWEDAHSLTVAQNADGTLTFKTDNGLYLYCDGKGVRLVTQQSDYTRFVWEKQDVGGYLRSDVATYNGNPQYLQVYNGYLGCYRFNDDTYLTYLFTLEDAFE